MIRSAMLAFLEGKTNLKEDIMDFEESAICFKTNPVI